MVDREGLTYTRCYCEENVWKLLHDEAPRISAGDAYNACNAAAAVSWAACFISNPNKTVAVACQAASQDELGLVVWDYHVVAIGPDPQTGQPSVFDLDTTLPFPCPIEEYWHKAFLTDWLPPRLHPMFRVVKRDDFLAHFSSDRSHMLRDGDYIAAPPPYPPIQRNGVATNLMKYIEMSHEDRDKGVVCATLDAVLEYVAGDDGDNSSGDGGDGDGDGDDDHSSGDDGGNDSDDAGDDSDGDYDGRSGSNGGKGLNE
ncbi:WDYHV domain-containing protein containing 1 [Salpingoeca rosetta]|uniref:Protein N-terminal glutamine amidohydrolase n=1 Tax=Salpingoeca rosetta (strain ATCC 50818 / BSB-021) TaxID=946362 RepID=F2UK85_SALR5|nr:WDYHV domain-containing protein containing 1 [Salpingoeca rosetta]EGD77534.1 WDYHV domain-containing protein containing 1 [Salpingoeca rosetta]|eukprot:XP_004990422.1 WDYHV domain-containing protein containing 1 [Salpingoeca rosetta]